MAQLNELYTVIRGRYKFVVGSYGVAPGRD